MAVHLLHHLEAYLVRRRNEYACHSMAIWMALAANVGGSGSAIARGSGGGCGWIFPAAAAASALDEAQPTTQQQWTETCRW